MNNYILVAEIEKIIVPCSLEFRSKNFVYYLYPYDVNERISLVKSKLNDIDDYFKNYQTNPIRNNLVILKDENSKTIIFTEIQETDDSIEKEPFDYVIDYFSIILKTLNLFYTNIFNIKRISIFKKVGTISKLIRIIGNYPEIELESPRGNELLENIDVRYFEPFFPKILEKISKNQQFTDVFDEYINGKIIKKIEYKIVYLWNTLEHISERFLKSKKKHMVIQATKFKELKSIIQIKMDELKQSDLVFAENLEEAKHIIISKMNNYPQIIDKILFMFKKYNLYSIDTEQIIRKVYYLRNRIFHDGIYMPQLLPKFKNNFFKEKPVSIKDLEHLLKNFELCINKILIWLLELNQIFDLDENSKLIWKERFPIDDSYFNYILTTEDGRKIEQAVEIQHSHFKSKIELEAYAIKTIEYLSRKPKYLKLINFLNTFQEYWRKLLSLKYIPSYIEGYGENFFIKFEDEKNGHFTISTNSSFMEKINKTINAVKGPKNLDLKTYIYILNCGTIQLKLHLVKLIESLDFKGETRGEFYCSQLDYGSSEFEKFEDGRIIRRGKCAICKKNVREINLINPKFFGRFFPMSILYICNNCKHSSSQEIFIYPIISEQFVQIPIHIMKGEKCIRKGNGFFYVQIKDKKKYLFFITTYKIITGHFPTEDYSRSGESAKLIFHTSRDDRKKNLEIELPLYTKENSPVWFQSEKNNRTDIVIIPILPLVHQNTKFIALSRKNLEIPTKPSNNLFLSVIGFKNGIYGNGLPQIMGFHLYKDEFLSLLQKTNISIEPYNGMEGSPVFVFNNNFEEGEFQHIFIGIYSDFQNGTILKTNLIIEQIDKYNPKKYISEIFLNLPYTRKVHLK